MLPSRDITADSDTSDVSAASNLEERNLSAVLLTAGLAGVSAQLHVRTLIWSSSRGSDADTSVTVATCFRSRPTGGALMVWPFVVL